MTDETISGADIDELLVFMPAFEDPEREYVVDWLPPWHAVYAEDVNAFFDLLSKPKWQDHGYSINEAGEMIHDDAFVAKADLQQIKTMFTFCVRGERFSSGHWEAMLKQGRITALLKRLQELRETVEG